MKIHPDVLAAHAQFGGDLELMQKAYEHPDLVAEVARLRAALVEERKRALESAAKVAERHGLRSDTQCGNENSIAAAIRTLMEKPE
jgi:hypothetical protein